MMAEMVWVEWRLARIKIKDGDDVGKDRGGKYK